MITYLTRTEVALKLRISLRHFDRIRKAADFPQPSRPTLGRLVWNEAVIGQWMEGK